MKQDGAMKAVIFDLDDTLVVEEATARSSLVEALTSSGGSTWTATTRSAPSR